MKSKNIYTPEVFVAGEEHRSWRSFKFTKKELEPAPLLKIIKRSDGEYEAVSESKDVTIHIAQLSFNQQTLPKRGENAGVNLMHDFVIKQWQTKSLRAQPSAKSAIIAWIEDAKGQPLQAVGAWLN